MLRLIVRAACEADRPALIEIYRQGIEAVHPERTLPASWAAEYERDTHGERVIVAELARGPVVGMLAYWEDDSFVHHLYIDARYRRRGIGRGLLDCLDSRLKKPYLLKCLVSNRGARAFYRRLGWKEVGREQGADGASVLLQLD